MAKEGVTVRLHFHAEVVNNITTPKQLAEECCKQCVVYSCNRTLLCEALHSRVENIVLKPNQALRWALCEE